LVIQSLPKVGLFRDDQNLAEGETFGPAAGQSQKMLSQASSTEAGRRSPCGYVKTV
jgi:hypothetical protein